MFEGKKYICKHIMLINTKLSDRKKQLLCISIQDFEIMGVNATKMWKMGTDNTPNNLYECYKKGITKQLK